MESESRKDGRLSEEEEEVIDGGREEQDGWREQLLLFSHKDGNKIKALK